MDSIELPGWLEELRRSEVVDRVQSDSRSAWGKPLGVASDIVRHDVIGMGQAEFDEPWNGLPAADRVLLYAYFNMRGHLEELTEAFGVIFGETPPKEELVVVDLGCGPFTGGLAIAGALPSGTRFDYIGVDRSTTMRDFGEQLAVAADNLNDEIHVDRYWYEDLADVSWKRKPSWRPVFVIVSYLLASSTLDVEKLVADLGKLFDSIGSGSVTLFYTNSEKIAPNRNFPKFKDALLGMGFQEIADDIDVIQVSRMAGQKNRSFRYALFHRPKKDTLNLNGA